MSPVGHRSPHLLMALLDSVAGDIARGDLVDLTRHGLARTWLEGRRFASSTSSDGLTAPTLVLCDLDDLEHAAGVVAADGLVIARSARDDRRAMLLARRSGMVVTSSVRDRREQWHMLVRMVTARGAPYDATIVTTVQDQARGLLRLMTVLAADDGPFRWSFVVVDRGSKDETPALLTHASGDLTVVTVPRAVSACHALDLGMQVARAPLVVAIDPDFVPTPTFVHAAIDAAACMPELDVFTGPVLDGGTGEPLRATPPRGRGVVPMANPELFAVRVRDGRPRGPTVSPETPETIERWLRSRGPAAYVPLFAARRPSSVGTAANDR